MRYIFSKNSIYYFRRKIPHSSYNFTFSLNTKNIKIARRKTLYFLKFAEYIFSELKNSSKGEIMQNMDLIRATLSKYRQKALEEYSQFEEDRHSDFTCKSKKGNIRDGGHPKCIKKWLKTIQEAVFTKHNRAYIELFERIFSRTDIDRDFYENLNEEEKRFFRIELLKTETKILREDYQRAKERFSTSFTNMPLAQTQDTNEKKKAFYEKTAQEIAEDFFNIKSRDTQELNRYIEPISIFLQVVKKKYLIDIKAEDIQDFVFTMKNLPPQVTKEDKDLVKQYENNYYGLAQYISDNGLETVSLKVALEKIRKVSTFLDYAMEIERLDKNRLNVKYIMPSKVEIQKKADKEKKPRKKFETSELNLLFNESSWYNKNLEKSFYKEQDKFYIPLIGLFAGTRLNEAAQLYIDDIKQKDNIYYFQIDKKYPNQKLKNLKSKRLIPIHSKLIEFGFIDYVNKLKKSNETRVFPQLYHTKRKGYGQAFSKKFNNKRFKLQFLSEERLEERILLDFHSFRHCFASRLVGRIRDSIVDKFMGHSGKSENQKRYSDIDMKFLKENIEKLDISDLDFSKIENLVSSKAFIEV